MEPGLSDYLCYIMAASKTAINQQYIWAKYRFTQMQYDCEWSRMVKSSFVSECSISPLTSSLKARPTNGLDASLVGSIRTLVPSPETLMDTNQKETAL